jgi:hypothetical protein
MPNITAHDSERVSEASDLHGFHLVENGGLKKGLGYGSGIYLDDIGYMCR